VIVLAALLGCSAEPPTADPPVPVAASSTDDGPSESSASAEGGEESVAHVSGFTFVLPAGWRQAELTPEQQGFVDARFEIDGHGDDVRLTMSTTSGGVEANVERWLGQFQQEPGSLPVQESLEVDGTTVTWVDVSGEYRGMGGPPQSGWRMLAAAFHGDPRDFYVKLTGPEEALAELEAPFRKFIESAQQD
jgi:hypothetical protein